MPLFLITDTMPTGVSVNMKLGTLMDYMTVVKEMGMPVAVAIRVL